MTGATGTLRRWAFALALGLPALLSGCASQFERYDVGNLTFLIGPPRAVHRECEARGVVFYSTQQQILGCMDFANHTIVSIPYMTVLAHELCHWLKQTPSHDECPTPLFPNGLQDMITGPIPEDGP